MTYPATNLNEAVGLIVPDSNALHDIINGDAEDIVITPEGREVPTVLKAMADSLLFKDAITWEEGGLEQDPLQLRTFTDGLIYWAPTAQLTNPIAMGASPVGDSNWKISPIIKTHNSLTNRDEQGAHPASAIDGVRETFDNVLDLQGALHLKVGQTVSTSGTAWKVVSNPTYTLPYSHRTKLFNNLPLNNGLYAYPSSTLFVDEFCSDSVDADNDDAIGLMVSIVRDGMKIDPCGKFFRVFANVVGIPSATASKSDNAGDISKMLFFDDFENLTFGRGGFYAANQGASPEKMYYPSTLSLINCKNIHFEKGSLFEGKGENYGDADASITETSNRRLIFSATNGGHAIYAGRCDGVYGSPTARLCGSASVIYLSSSRGALENPFANAASLGYAAINVDAWVGSLVDTGFKDFCFTVTNPIAHAETLTRREDNNPAGSSIYAGKGGLLTEDAGVSIISTGGYIADMYANGANKALGYAFGAGSGSVCKNVGAIVRNCQEVAYANSTTNELSVCIVNDVDAEVGLTGLMFDSQPFGQCEITLSGKVRVSDYRLWVGENKSLSKTSLIASLKSAGSGSWAYAKVSCDAGGDIYSLISNKRAATYGGVVIDGGVYITNGYLVDSKGWGRSTSGQDGLLITGGAVIKDVSDSTDTYIKYTNRSDENVFTYVYHDMFNSHISTKNFRSLDWATQGADSLVDKLSLPSRFDNCYTTDFKRVEDGANHVILESRGLSGANTLITLLLPDNKPFKGSFITSDSSILKLLGASGAYRVEGADLKRDYLISGDVRGQFTVGATYSIVGAY